MYECIGLDDTADTACTNQVVFEGTLCNDCYLETIAIYERIALARKAKEDYANTKEDTRNWALLKPIYKVSLPAQALVLALFCLLMEAFVRPCVR